MKKLFVSALSMIAFISTAMAQNATITVHPQDGKEIIPKEIYGQFAEHLGRCIYGGLWVGKDSKIPNVEGYRKDVFEAIKALEVPVMRWPGGCFADEYHWMDGIGDLSERPRMVNTNWGGTVEDNSFGTHEFLNLCELLGCEPYVSGNVGSGTMEEMAKWVEYMTSDTNSTMAELRRKNGREKPWKVKFFGVGNESWGCGGNMRPEYYADLFRRYATYARNYGDNKLYRIASGANANDTNWTEVLMKQIGPRKNMAGYSVHYYAVRNWNAKGEAVNFTPQEYYETLSRSLGIEDCIVSHMKIMDKYDPEKRVGLLVDEWGTWWEVEKGTNPGWLYQQCTMRDAVVASSSLDIFHKYTDRVKMANIAQVVNVLQSMILTNEKNPEDGIVLTPTYHIFNMYKVHKEATFLPSTIVCDSVRVNEKEIVPTISTTASKDKNGIFHISVTNMNMEKGQEVTVALEGVKVKTVSGTILTSEKVADYNDFSHPATIAPQPFKDCKVKKDVITLKVPKHSVVTLEVKAS